MYLLLHVNEWQNLWQFAFFGFFLEVNSVKHTKKIPAVTHLNTLSCRNFMVFEEKKKKKKATQPLDSTMCPLISRYHILLTAYKAVCDADLISV